MPSNPEQRGPETTRPPEQNEENKEASAEAPESSKTEIEKAWDERISEAETAITQAETEYQAADDAYIKAESFAKEHQDSEFLEKVAERSFGKMKTAKQKLDDLKERLAKLKSGYFT